MSSPIVEKKKRGRKKQNIVLTVEETPETPSTKPPPKKRGRKPKGGKIIQQNTILTDNTESEPNIILHLKCSNDDIVENKDYSLKYDPNIENIKSFNFDNMETNNFLLDNKNNINNNIINNNNNNNSNNDIDNDDCSKTSKNELWDKLNQLKVNLHKNNISDKRSACFWCTYDFDNPPIFIPKNEFKNNYQVYGCFCSPECSSAYLMNEKIDSSVKFERYQLLNHVYGKIYDYKKNIKPSPNPFYLLDKYYGTLTIKEYRDLFKNDQLLIVVDKPLTHVFPELYEDNSDFILNQRTIPTNSTYKLKRKGTVPKKASVLDDLTSKN
jgi:hypothetical protein